MTGTFFLSPDRPRGRQYLAPLAGLGGLALLVWLVAKAGPGRLAAQLSALGHILRSVSAPRRTSCCVSK